MEMLSPSSSLLGRRRKWQDVFHDAHRYDSSAPASDTTKRQWQDDNIKRVISKITSFRKDSTEDHSSRALTRGRRPPILLRTTTFVLMTLLSCCLYAIQAFPAPSQSLVSSPVTFLHSRFQQQQFTSRDSFHHSKSLLHVASPQSSDLASLTVKELKQMIKDGSQPVERGLLSKLKRKQDLIDYLEAQPQTNGNVVSSTISEVSAASINGSSKPTTPPKRPMKMPALDTSMEDDEELVDPDNDSNEVEKKKLSFKEKIFEKVFERYPPLRDEYLAIQEAEAAAALLQGDDEGYANSTDMRQLYHPIFESTNHVSSCDMDVVFVGTASCTPGITRGVSCTALRLNWKPRNAFQEPNKDNNHGSTYQPSVFQGGTWLFDVGECTQLQVQRTSAVKPSKITKIFVTHAHGDHSFGLPGLLCLMGQDRDRATAGESVIEIYGPEGLRKWLRVAIRYSVSRIVPPYRVHELKEVPMAPEWQYNPRAGRYYYKGLSNHKGKQGPKEWGRQGLAGEDPTSWISQADRILLDPSQQYGEVKGGRDIYPIYGHPLSSDGAPVWEVEDEDDVKVYAAPMSHGIPCVGYVVEESSRPGRLRNELVKPVVERNLQALKEAGFKIPMKAMAVIKNLPVGSEFTFPDGTVITQEEAVEPPRKGRKVVICGDTANCRALEKLAKDCDVLVHEATNAYLPGVDRDTSRRLVTRDAVVHGHSTPEIAGLFAKKVNAKRLLLNHFSARYKGDPSVDSMSIMMRIEQFAMEYSGLDERHVAAAWDLMVLPVPSHD